MDPKYYTSIQECNKAGIPSSIPEPHTPFDSHHLIRLSHVAPKRSFQSLGGRSCQKRQNPSMIQATKIWFKLDEIFLKLQCHLLHVKYTNPLRLGR